MLVICQAVFLINLEKFPVPVSSVTENELQVGYFRLLLGQRLSLVVCVCAMHM